MRGDVDMSDDTIEIFFTVEPIADAVLDTKEISSPVIKFLASQSCNSLRDELFVKVTNNRKETLP